MAECKNKGPCICGKHEQYLFTPHLTEEEEEDLYEEEHDLNFYVPLKPRAKYKAVIRNIERVE